MDSNPVNIENSVKAGTSRQLSDVLAEERDWPLPSRLRLIRRLAEQVGSLHREGRLHRRVEAAEVAIDGQFHPLLSDPPAGRRFGGECSDPEYCPAELAAADSAEPSKGLSMELPADIEAAAVVLRERGYDFDPRRIDIYQLGTLACRLLTNGSIREYMYTLDARQRLSGDLALLLDRMLGHGTEGHGGDGRIETIDELVELLADAKIQDIAKGDAEDASRSLDTPPEGSIVGRDGDTPPHGSQLQGSAGQSVEEIPFEQLGPYRVVRLIGRGGMGDVYLARDESLDRQVAIKVLPDSMAREESFVRRFHAEAMAAAKISHPNVVPIYSVSSEDDRHQFFAMQYIDGYTLAERLVRQRRLPAAEAIDLVEQCLAGLGAAHRAGLIHRDVKPGNILIEREGGRAVLVDFGLVRRMDGGAQLTATGTIMGTVDYIAPEQARGKSVDGRADIYALGILCYQMLSGRLPFEAETLVAMIFQHAYEEPMPLEEAAPGLPRAVTRLVARMMAKEPAERYQSCDEVLADIRAFRDGQPPAIRVESDSLAIHPTQAMPEPELPEDIDELVSAKHVQRLRNMAATIFRRHAPNFVKNLQNTTQQVDGAVATYERRRDRVAKLLEDARSIAAELSEQVEANLSAAAAAMEEAEAADDEAVEAAALAKKHDCDEHLAALRERAEEQQGQIEDLELQSNKAEATLAQLCSQRDALAARLRTAQAQQQMEGGGKPPRRRLRVALALGGLFVVIGAIMLLPWRSKPPQKNPAPIAMPVIAERGTYKNDFDTGIGPHFSAFSDGGLFTIDTDGPDVRISKPANDGTAVSTDWISGGVKSNFLVEGDFTVTVDFELDGFPFTGTDKMNESILGIVTDNGDQFWNFRFRSHLDRIGTWELPSGKSYGYTSSNLLEGQYRIQRSGSTMTALVAPAGSSAFTTIATVNGFLDPVRIQLFARQGSNRVNYPRPTTPLDIRFDNLEIIAEDIIRPAPTTTSTPDPAKASVPLVPRLNPNLPPNPTSVAGIDLIQWEENGHYYGLVEGYFLWLDAEAAAAALEFRGAKGHLVTIGSAAENTFVSSVVAPNTSNLHIGLTDRVSEGNFQWITGEPVVYTNWEPGEPNDSSGENYVRIEEGNGWNDIASWHSGTYAYEGAYVVEFEPTNSKNHKPDTAKAKVGSKTDSSKSNPPPSLEPQAPARSRDVDDI